MILFLRKDSAIQWWALVVTEVDQSGKIGDTGVATVLAFSDTESYAILIPAKVKRACIHELHRKEKSGTTLYVQLFAVGLFLLLKEAIEKVSLVTIALEYQDMMLPLRSIC